MRYCTGKMLRFGAGTAVLAVLFVFFCGFGLPAQAQEVEAASPPPVEAVPSITKFTDLPEMQETMTLEMFIEQGGPILWVIIALGFFALVLALYLLFTVSPRREAPVKLLRRVSNLVRSGDMSGALMLCENRDELAARVLGAGLKMADQDRFIIQEAMEGEGARGATELWQRISYLNNVGVVAPLLGLLGTVWGMILAFQTIAFEDAQRKGIMTAYYVSMAMITTAGGLIVAIPALLVYYYLRGRVVRVVAHVETQASEFVELLMRSRDK
jgi:biopolymer transport protein ExbB